jgi:hypothetical protein
MVRQRDALSRTVNKSWLSGAVDRWQKTNPTFPRMLVVTLPRLWRSLPGRM